MLILQKHCSTRCLSTKFCEIIYTEPIIVASFLTPGLPNKQEVLAAAWGGPATQFCAEPCANPRRSPQQFHLRKIVCLCGAATGRTCGHTHNTQTPHHIYTTYTSHTIHHTWIHTTHKHHTLHTQMHTTHHMHTSYEQYHTYYTTPHAHTTHHTDTPHTHHKQHTNTTHTKSIPHIHHRHTHYTPHTNKSHANTTYYTQTHATHRQHHTHVHTLHSHHTYHKHTYHTHITFVFWVFLSSLPFFSSLIVFCSNSMKAGSSYLFTGHWWGLWGPDGTPVGLLTLSSL